MPARARIPLMFLSTPPSRVATFALPMQGTRLNCFYPRHPRGWRLHFIKLNTAIANGSIHATLAGGDMTIDSFFFLNRRMFLSTPPSRVATAHKINAMWARVFLSTPPSRVATYAKAAVFSTSKGVSIHATLAGGDDKAYADKELAILFLSTPPSRVATRLECL